MYVCVPHFYDHSALVGCWSSGPYKDYYLQIHLYLNVYPFDYTYAAVNGKVKRTLTGLTTPVLWLLLLQLTVLSRSKSLCNGSFGGIFVSSRCFLDFSVGVMAFVIGLSQISSFFLI